MADRPSPQRVEVTVAPRTVVIALCILGEIALVLISLGTLISIFLATIVAMGLDPLVTGLQRRGWNRGTAAVFVFAVLFVAVFALVLVTIGPVWDEMKEFADALPTYWAELQQTDWFNTIRSAADMDDEVGNALKVLAAGLRE